MKKTLLIPPHFARTRGGIVYPQRFPICAEIDNGYSLNCDYPNVAGVKDRLILGNYGQIATVTKNGTTGAIEGITLSGSNKCYAYEGQNNSHQPSVKLVRKTYSNVFDHVVKFLIFNCTTAIKKQIEAMASGKFFAIIENNQPNADGDGAFEVFGLNVGLFLIELERDYSSDENQGAYLLTLGTPEKIKEPKLPATFFKTDYPTTKGLVDGLL